MLVFFFQAEDGIRDIGVTGVQTCALPISDTTTSVAPKASAAWTLTSPIGPAPVTSTREPAPTRPLRQAQMPTDRGSSRAAASSPIVSGTGGANAWGTTTYPAKAPSIGGGAKNRMPGDRKSTRLNSS